MGVLSAVVKTIWEYIYSEKSNLLAESISDKYLSASDYTFMIKDNVELGSYSFCQVDHIFKGNIHHLNSVFPIHWWGERKSDDQGISIKYNRYRQHRTYHAVVK